MQVKDLASVSLKQPVRIFVNSNTDVAPYLRQEFVRIRPAREGDREAIVAGEGKAFFSPLFSFMSILSSPLPSNISHLNKTVFSSLPLTFLTFSCPVSSAPHTHVPGPCDVVHPDQETGSPHAHPPRPHGVKGRRAPWQPVSDAKIGESQVHWWLSEHLKTHSAQITRRRC